MSYNTYTCTLYFNDYTQLQELIPTNTFYFLFTFFLLFLDDVQGDAGGINMLFFFLLVSVGALVDEEKENKKEETLGEKVTRVLIDELKVEHILRGNNGQCLHREERR